MIPYFDYRPEYERIRRQIDDAIHGVLASGSLVLGHEVRAFERECASFVGVGGAVGVNSGTDALILALRALGIGAGDEVLTVANAGAPPVAAIRACGAEPRFADVSRETLLTDAGRVERALTPRTRCLLLVHLYGQPVDLAPLLELARRRGIPVVEDCAQALGATYGGRQVGSFGTVACLSFYPTKNLGAFGDGGMCLTDDPQLEERLRLLRMYGFRPGSRSSEIEGLNSRLDELQAAILRIKLSRLDDTLKQRRALAHEYRGLLAGSECVPLELVPDSTHTYHLFVVRCRRRDRAIAALEAAGIGHGIHYPVAVHRMPAYAFLALDEGSLPESERASREVLSLPIYPGLPHDAPATVAAVLRAAG